VYLSGSTGDGVGNREAPPAAADASTRRDAVDNAPDFSYTATATKPKVCTSICPTNGQVTAAAPVTVTLSGNGTAVDDRSTVAVLWRLFGVTSAGASTKLFDFKAPTGDGSFNSRIELFQTADQRSDKGYKWYDVEIKVTAGTMTTNRVIRILIVEVSGTPA
jgi:hypothetical protein